MTCSVKSLDLHLRLLPSSMIFDCFFFHIVLQRSSILNGWLQIGLATVDYLVLLPAHPLTVIPSSYCWHLCRTSKPDDWTLLSNLGSTNWSIPYMKTRTWWNYFIEKSYWGWCRFHPSRWLNFAFEPGVGQLMCIQRRILLFQIDALTTRHFGESRQGRTRADCTKGVGSGSTLAMISSRWNHWDPLSEGGLSVWSSWQTRNVRCCQGRCHESRLFTASAPQHALRRTSPNTHVTTHDRRSLIHDSTTP